MQEIIRNIYFRLIQKLEISTYRYLYDKFDVKRNRLIGLIGARGVGKTTLLLQTIVTKLDKNECFYVSLDNIYFASNTLVELVEKLYEEENIKTYFLDEVHKYKNWNQEIKNIYDSFPDILIIFSGSSSLDIKKGIYDLSRRSIIYKLSGLSFREYLNFKLGTDFKKLEFEQIIADHKNFCLEISKVPCIKKHFKIYLNEGYYPFVFEGKEFFIEKLNNVIEKIIHEDISNYYDLKTQNLYIFKRILNYLASIPPGEVNINNLSNNLDIDNKTTKYYLNILQDTGLVRLLQINKKGSKQLRSPQKIYLDNPNIYSSISSQSGLPDNIGTKREIFFINACENSGNKVLYSKEIGDFFVNNRYFEVGGKSKSKRQIKTSIDNSFLVKDDILIGTNKEIPLYLFGFLY